MVWRSGGKITKKWQCVCCKRMFSMSDYWGRKKYCKDCKEYLDKFKKENDKKYYRVSSKYNELKRKYKNLKKR